LLALLAGSLAFAIALALHDELVGVVGEPIECALGEDGVVEQGDPLLDRTIVIDQPKYTSSHIIVYRW
jgi:hypothetical protein